MNDCLFLPLRQGAAGTRPLSNWQSCWLPLGEGEAEGLPAGKGKAWTAVEVPSQLASSEGRQAIWYRTAFPRPDHSGRVVLRLGGAFLAANVWVNGKLLGSHYGYFAAFGFDVTSLLRPENLLVICCESPVELETYRKRHLMGWFNDGDDRPYPASAFQSLPEPYRWEVPLGLWRPVELEHLGAVILDWVRLRPRLEAGVGRLEVECRLRNLDAREMAGEVAVEVSGPGASGLRLRREFKLPGGLEQTATMTLSIPGAERWWPWRLGEPILYSARVGLTVGGRETSAVRERFGFREVEVESRSGDWRISVNGRRLFLRGACYQPSLRLDELSEESFRRDLELARTTNLDALRVHAHVLPEEFYRLADEAGVLLLQDLPLSGPYAYHAGPDEGRFFENAARAQLDEMVQMLANRPSVLLWSGHDDAPWLPSASHLGDVFAVRQNHAIDQELKERAESLDPSREALAASGETDLHTYLGWRSGSWSDLGDLEPGLVTEFGAQALPSLDSPAWRELGGAWPVGDAEPRWIYGGFLPGPWSERGVGLPSAYESLEDYVLAGQEYQALLLRHAIDQFRRRKFEPCSGAFPFQLTDSFPGVGFGLVDSARRPRLALEAVREAMAPVRLIVEPTGFEPLHPIGYGYRSGSPASFRLVVVNDDPELAGEATVRWSLWRERGPEQTGINRVLELVRRKSFAGSAVFELPTCDEPAVQVAAISVIPDLDGAYRLEAELTAGGRLLQTSSIELEVSSGLEPPPPPSPVPAYLAARLVDLRSLASDASGLSFELRNQARPAVLDRLEVLSLDGAALSPPRLLLETAAGRVPLPRKQELPLGRSLKVIAELDAPLERGSHEVEILIAVPAIAEGVVRIAGRRGTGSP